MLIVQVCDFGSDGDAHYRLHDPSRQMGKLPGVTTIDCHFFSRHLPDLIDLADVMVLQFVNDWDLLSACLRRRAAGKVTVFEANDYFFDVQSWNPIAPSWHDRNNLELYLQLLAQADGVQTSTDALARRWRQRGARQVAVFRNHLTDLPPLGPPRDPPLTIGWAGSPGHLGDWYAVAPMLQRWLDAHPDVRLAVMTDEPGRAFFQLPPQRYRFEPFGSLPSYLKFIEGIDIGLAPLLPTDYNRGRSDVKFLEYASRGVAGIYTDLEPYRDVVIPGQTGLLCRTPQEMLEHLDHLHSDAALRQQIRRGAYDYVTTRRIGSHVAERVEWYKDLLAEIGRSRAPVSGSSAGKVPPVPSPAESRPQQKPPVGAPAALSVPGAEDPETAHVQSAALPQEIVRDAAREGQGNYLQLPLREAETSLRGAIHGATAPQTAMTLNAVLARHPRYLLAMQKLGYVLNTQRDHRAALASLERANTLRPGDPHTLSEMGRTWYLLDDVARARQALEEALTINPHYLPAWQYLLRMLAFHRSADGPAWSQRAEEAFPACYPVALLGARTWPPEQIPQVVQRLIDRHVPTLTRNERPLALAAFREAVVLAAKHAPLKSALPMLRRACEYFPESAILAGELGLALFQAGEADEAYLYQSRALALFQEAAIIRTENERNDPPPLTWRLAQHIRAAQTGVQKGQIDEPPS